MLRIILVILSLNVVFEANAQNSGVVDEPKVTLIVTLLSDTVKMGQDVKITIKITNHTTKTQKLLFDKPVLWGFSGKVIDLNTRESVVAYPSKAVLRSQAYLQKELEKYYYYLETGQTIFTQTILEEIVGFNTGTYHLPKGRYQMELFYSSSSSNKVVFYIH